MKNDKGEILKGALLLITISLWVLVAVCAVIITTVNPGLLPETLALIVCCCMIVNITRRRSHEE